jgi:hypothetical protein
MFNTQLIFDCSILIYFQYLALRQVIAITLMNL